MTKEDKLFLDKAAIEVMKIYINSKPPQGFDDSVKISRVSYSQALAMLEVRKNQLSKMIEERNLKLD